jgi:hypothetical protein
MTTGKPVIGILLAVMMTIVMAGCSDVGVGGIGVTYPGAKWGSGATGPGVIVSGGYP